MNDVLIEVETKKCPICSQVLSLAEFGICRARKDGRNLYCKSCIRQKVSQSRRAMKEYKTARKRCATAGADSNDTSETGSNDPHFSDRERTAVSYGLRLGKLSPVDRVREAIRRGARTQKDIAQETKLGKDEIGDALANLLLWSKEIRTELVDNARVYMLNETSNAAFDELQQNVPRRKRDVPSSFSSLQGLMPGRNPEGEAEKIGGWVAA